MRPRLRVTALCAISMIAACITNPHISPANLDIDVPADNLNAFLKRLGNTDGWDTVMWWSGQIFAVMPCE